MKKRSSFWMGLAAVVLALSMIGATLVTAGADSKGLTEDEINAIVNTTTDASKITSPFIQVADQVRNSVVGVNNYATTTSYYGYGFGYGYGRQPQTQEVLRGTGSGVVVSNVGHVLTNYHVVEGATRVTVTTALDESEHEAQVVGYDADLDIAVLEVSGLNLPAVPLGDSDQLQVGEWAIVIGNPLGEDFARTLTVGVVSALDRQITDSSTDRYGRRTTITNTMIQVDAAINSGNSGGGLFNTLGQLQGIPARKYSSNGFFSASIDNIGMCIPINVAKPLIDQVLKDYEGEKEPVTRSQAGNNNVNEPLLGKPRLGVTITTILNDSEGVLPQGAFVRVVEDGAPASQAGIQPGDIIVAVDDEVISSSVVLTEKLKSYQEGDSVAITIYRAEGLREQAEEQYVDLTKVGEGDYQTVNVELRVIDQVEQSL